LPAQDNESLLLARDGKATTAITISTNASDATKAVAGELAGYLKQIAGADFAVKPGNGSTGIVLGTLAEFPNPGLAKPLELRDQFDGKEAYAIRTETNRVLLIGATDLGVSHAAARMLEIIGYRRFFPAREWEIVPSIPDLSFSTNETSRPAILSRKIAFGFGRMREPGNRDVIMRAGGDYQAWCRHNRMGSSFEVRAGHSWKRIIDRNKEEFDKHPEYYALVGGKRRVGGKFELANPAVRKMVVDFALEQFREHPERDMISVEPSDGGNQSESEEARELGSFSDQVFGLANEVARAVQKEFPGKMVGLLAYGWHSDPPAFDLEPNVYVERTAGFTFSKHTDEELLDLWAKKTRNLGIYEYFSVWTWDADRLPGGRAADTAYLQEAIRRYAALPARSITAESSNSWGPHGRGYLVASRLMWDPQADVSALLTDFYEKAFGPAAPAMRRYYERLDRGNKPLLSKTLLALAYRDVGEASRLAKERPDVQARLDHIKQYLRYNHLRWQMDRARTKAERKNLTLAWLTHGYRTRFSYMNHWEAMRQMETAKAAKAFDEPTWSSLDPSTNKPWMVKTPLTREETEKQFREGLAYFQPQEVTERSFSQDLVPVRFANTPSTMTEQSFQGPANYALYSVAGEPLRVEIQAGLLEIFRAKTDLRYSLTDTNRTTIAEGRVPLDPPSKHRLELKVPRPGLYRLDVKDSGAGWRISVEADHAASLELSRDQMQRFHGGIQDHYFYVPKGTKQISYYWRGGPHEMIGPGGKRVRKLDVDCEFVSIPVPAGQDGKPWRFSAQRVRHLVFFNVPNAIAASPNALLIPREVARADGLAVRVTSNPGSP
jgi:hypothetical protein